MFGVQLSQIQERENAIENREHQLKEYVLRERLVLQEKETFLKEREREVKEKENILERRESQLMEKEIQFARSVSFIIAIPSSSRIALSQSLPPMFCFSLTETSIA